VVPHWGWHDPSVNADTVFRDAGFDVTRKPIREVTFLDPAEGSGHFHLEAFDLFYAMYAEEATREGRTLTPREIAAAILNHNLYGIDIDGRSVQIATAALWMKAKERSPDLEASDLTSFREHLVATNIRLPKGKNHLDLFLQKHPEDKDLTPALELVFQGLEHADELGALLQIEDKSAPKFKFIMLGGSDALMIGQTLWTEFFQNKDWPVASAAALGLLYMALIRAVNSIGLNGLTM